MPLFDYLCSTCGAKEELLVSLDAPHALPCKCGDERFKQPAAPNFDLEWTRGPIDSVSEVWGDADTDGVNETQYESTTAFMETS